MKLIVPESGARVLQPPSPFNIGGSTLDIEEMVEHPISSIQLPIMELIVLTAGLSAKGGCAVPTNIGLSGQAGAEPAIVPRMGLEPIRPLQDTGF
jgi:hypothetical protein